MKKTLLCCLLILTVIAAAGCSSDDSNNATGTTVSSATEATERSTGKSYIAKPNFIEDSDVDINNTESQGRFCYSQLSDKQKLYYEKLRTAVKQQRSGLYWNNRECTAQELDDLLNYITYDYPEYFWFSKENTGAETINGKLVFRVKFHYEYDADRVKELQGKLKTVTDKFLKEAKKLKTDYEKSLYTYEYIINNTKYNQKNATAGYNNFAEMESDRVLACWNITGALLNGDAVCRGYTQAYQYLMNLQGIECAYVVGNSHCWNLTKLDDEWYYTDVTWGDPFTEGTDPETGEVKYTEDGIDYSYLNMTTEQLLKIHKLDPSFKPKLPECTATKNSPAALHSDNAEEQA